MKRHDSMFLTMMQDSKGFIWGGGFKNGLWRYDGQEFKLYKQEPGDQNSMQGRTILFLQEDEKGHIWIGSDYGLHDFDPYLEKFKNYALDTSIVDPEDPNARTIAFFHRDQNGNYWTANDAGLHIWDATTMRSRLFTAAELKSGAVKLNVVGNTSIRPAFAEDEGGQIWLGIEGESGLYRFDPVSGRGKMYRHDPEDANSLMHDQVLSLHVDPEGTLWIGTAGGLCRYVPEDDKFISYNNPQTSAPDGRQQPVLQIDTDRSGRMWVVRSFLVQRFDKEKARLVTLYEIDDWRPRGGRRDPMRRDHSFCFIGEGENGIVWFTTLADWNRVFGYDPELDTIVPYAQIRQAGEGSIIASMVDQNGHLWLSYTNGGGLYQQDIAQERFAAFGSEESSVQGVRFGNLETSATATTSFYKDQLGKVWLNTEKLSHYYPQERRWAPTVSSLRQLPRQFLNFEHPVPMLEDSRRDLWVAIQEGLIRFPSQEKSKRFANLAYGKPTQASAIAPYNLRNGPESIVDEIVDTRWLSASASESDWVTVDLQSKRDIEHVSLYWGRMVAGGDFTYRLQASDDGTVWRTIFEETIPPNQPDRSIDLSFSSRFLRISGIPGNKEQEMALHELEVYGPMPKFETYLGSAASPLGKVYDIKEDKAGRLWLASDYGLWLYRSAENSFDLYQAYPADAAAGSNALYMILEQANGSFWLKPTPNNERLPGILAFDPRSETFTHYHSPSSGLSSDFIYDALIDKEDRLWVATKNSVQQWDTDTRQFNTIIASQGTDNFNYLFQDSRGKVWVAELSNGIYCIDPATAQVRHYKDEKGWVNNIISHPIEDDRGFIWMANAGLMRFDPAQGSFWHFGQDDGLHSDRRGALYKDQDGYLYFGNEEGFTAFHPEQINPIEKPPQIVITGFKLFGEDVQPGAKDGLLSQPIANTTRLDLPHDGNVFTFEFTGLHFFNPDKIRYEVKMDGVNREWVSLGSRRFVDYQGLAPGNYTFLLRAANADGVWSEPHQIDITVHPPWWWTTWAKILYVLTAIGIVVGYYQWKTYSLRQRQKELEKTVTERTAEVVAEKERSEALLLNILPQETAEELKQYGAAQAKNYDMVTVLFTDFKDFSSFAQQWSPQELVAEIDYCYKAFDLIMEEFKVEKIKTIGDAYMAAAGLPTPTTSNPADAVRAALAIRDFMARYQAERAAANKDIFEIRIGVHTGPVVAGIVGIKKFAYDIWGDTVNTAARMESNGEAGKVNISRKTYDHLKDLAEFSFISRGEIEAKGIGLIGMYFVDRKS